MRILNKSMLGKAICGVLGMLLLLPVLCEGGSLEPPASAVDSNKNPVPTMKTLDQIPPTWSRKLPTSERFELVLDNEAVLDKETGLVWKKTLSTQTHTWFAAHTAAYYENTGGRKGWRLPTVEELSSLMDMTITSSDPPKLPSGHPFVNVVPLDYYWTSITEHDDAGRAYTVSFGYGDLSTPLKTETKYVWPVRGGYGHDAY